MANLQHGPAAAVPVQLAANKKLIREQGWIGRLEGDLSRVLGRVSDLVRMESPTSNPAAVEAVQKHILSSILYSKTASKCTAGIESGVLEVRFGDPSGSRRPVLLLGHLDTVWPIGTLAEMPWRVEDGWAYGPGSLDMKAGVVMALEAIRLAHEVDPARPVILFASGDEETGSHRSRQRIEHVARECSAVFVLEPAQGPQGAYKTARKGVGQFRLEVEGVAAHSGVDFAAGHSAVRELAWQIEQVSALTDLEQGTTLNVGVIGGGTQSNVVAASARAEIDLRVTTLAHAESVIARLRALTPRDPACRLTLTGELNRPPMERTPGTVALFEQARLLAAEAGFALEEAATGGGSDGNFTSALGVSTLDGMGAIGRGAHARNESIRIDSLAPRTALLAGMIATII